MHKKLHAGCGKNYLSGWINLDLDAPIADIHHNLENPLPFASNTFSHIYSEHLLEHLDQMSGSRFMAECFRTLAPNGICRIAMPDLDYLVECYQGDWKKQDWLSWPAFQHIQTRAEMMNIAMRSWGHQYLYNREELERRLKEAGFHEIIFTKNSKSSHLELSNLETRPDSILIAEAKKLIN